MRSTEPTFPRPELPCFTPLDTHVVRAIAAATGISLDKSVCFSLEFAEPGMVFAVVKYHIESETMAGIVKAIASINASVGRQTERIKSGVTSEQASAFKSVAERPVARVFASDESRMSASSEGLPLGASVAVAPKVCLAACEFRLPVAGTTGQASQ